jgi:hypothetical protein
MPNLIEILSLLWQIKQGDIGGHSLAFVNLFPVLCVKTAQNNSLLNTQLLLMVEQQFL